MGPDGGQACPQNKCGNCSKEDKSCPSTLKQLGIFFRIRRLMFLGICIVAILFNFHKKHKTLFVFLTILFLQIYVVTCNTLHCTQIIISSISKCRNSIFLSGMDQPLWIKLICFVIISRKGPVIFRTYLSQPFEAGIINTDNIQYMIQGLLCTWPEEYILFDIQIT